MGSDQNSRPRCLQLLQRAHQRDFSITIEIGLWLIKTDQCRNPEQCAGECDAAPLPRRQVCPSLSDLGVEPLG